MTDNKTNAIIKAERNKYLKTWRAKNKDKVRKYNQTYWLKKSQQAESLEKNEEVNNGK